MREIPKFTVEPRSRRTPREGIVWWMLENEKVWEFVRGVDFVKLASLKSAAYAAAKRRGMSAHISVTDEDHVEVQFTKGRGPGGRNRTNSWRDEQRRLLGLD